MTGDEFEEKVRSLFETAEPTPPLEPGWERRAMEAMARPADRPSRLRLASTVAGTMMVLLALGFAPYTASSGREAPGAMLAMQQALAAEVDAEATAEATPSPPAEPSPMEQMEKQLASYRDRAVEFVAREYPDDAEMLMAVALLRSDSADGLALLKDAAETSGSKVAWTAYVNTLAGTAPGYGRVGGGGGDPEDAQAMAEEERMVREFNLPTRLSPEEMAPFLDAVHGWEEADPENGLPYALEMLWLYGLHRDAEALARWERAGKSPKVTVHFHDVQRAVARLLSRMGMSEFEALSAGSQVAAGANFGSFARLRHCARIATYEGRVAQMAGRHEDAIRWWHGTVGLGRHMQDTDDTIVGVLVGVAVVGIGASPAWRWYSDSYTGIPGGPLFKGRILYGRQHEFYVSQVGEAADAELRDAVVLGKVRSQLMRAYSRSGSQDDSMVRWAGLLGVSGMAVGLLVALLALFVGISVRARRQADEATELGGAERGWIILAALLPAVAGGAIYLSQIGKLFTHPVLGWVLVVGVGAALPLLLVSALLVARGSRRPSARLATAWRGNLRRVLPACIVICAMFSVGLGIAGKVRQRSWLRERYSPSYNEMGEMRESMGSAWTDPEIPADSWRAEYPPEPQA